ncbi:hypothetical protein [Bifidobacterium xylocopae]|nr:hypothetical protein [Bifidobacterium xylocopae]
MKKPLDLGIPSLQGIPVSKQCVNPQERTEPMAYLAHLLFSLPKY